MLHGLPGNEQNLDLARVFQRAGWTVIIFINAARGNAGTFAYRAGVDHAHATYSCNNTATRDDPDDQAIALPAKLKRRHGRHVASAEPATDHGFNDDRIALEVGLLDRLARLPGAPPLR